MTEQHFDIVIIGAGTRRIFHGTACRATRQRWRSSSVTTPWEALASIVDAFHRRRVDGRAWCVRTGRQAERMGINAALQSIDFGRLRDFRTSTVKTMTKGLAGLLSHRGVTVFRSGEAGEGRS